MSAQQLDGHLPAVQPAPGIHDALATLPETAGQLVPSQPFGIVGLQ
ncbi:hypothetical protein [Actinoallomurus sp. NPDC050550]